MRILDAYDHLERMERALSKMYAHFAALFADQDVEAFTLFSSLSDDEIAHQDIVRFQRKMIPRDSKAEVEISVGQVDAITKRSAEALGEAPALPAALRFSVGIESMAAEYHYRTAVEQVSPEVAALVRTLGDSDALHLDRLRDFVAARFGRDDLLAHFGRHGEMLARYAEEKAKERGEAVSREDSATAETDPVQAKRIASMALTAKRAGHYQLLGLKEDASPEEVNKAYRALSSTWQPDRFPGIAGDASRDLNEISTAISDAYAVLTDPGRRATYDATLRKDPVDKGLHIVSEDEQFAIEGWSLLSAGQYREALKRFRNALEHSRKPKFFHGYAVSLRFMKRYEEALDAIGSALEESPERADYLVEKANLLAAMGRRREARESLERALKAEPGHAKAAAALRKLSGGSGVFGHFLGKD